ncbi:MAG TPA: hypothetical protein VHU40_02140 [Polyangia bacterium]|nr:hypothetical protein [Polyangia bacterium]
MLVSAGLAIIARAVEVPHGMVAGPLLIALGFGAVVGGLVLVGLERARRALGKGRSRRPSWANPSAWDEVAELDRLTGFEAAWEGAARAGESATSVSRSRLREASRALLQSFEGEEREATRSRRAIRSACRRAHVRAAGASRPKRHRVRPRARLFM